VPIDMDWLGGLSPMLAQLSRDIRRQLQRDPDLGDLLLTIACAPDTLAGRALREVGVELDALWGTLERIRQQESEERESLRRRIEALRAEKERAIAGQEFAEAGRLRDEALELSEQTRRLVSVGEVLAEVRRRLGLTSPEE
jgi:hypothetical protein